MHILQNTRSATPYARPRPPFFSPSHHHRSTCKCKDLSASMTVVAHNCFANANEKTKMPALVVLAVELETAIDRMFLGENQLLRSSIWLGLGYACQMLVLEISQIFRGNLEFKTVLSSGMEGGGPSRKSRLVYGQGLSCFGAKAFLVVRLKQGSCDQA